MEIAPSGKGRSAGFSFKTDCVFGVCSRHNPTGAAFLKTKHRGLPTLWKPKLKKRWLEICAEAAVEIDPDCLKKLAVEINRLLSDEELRLRQFPPIKVRV